MEYSIHDKLVEKIKSESMDIICSVSIDGGNPANEYKLFFDKDVLGIKIGNLEHYIKLNKIVEIALTNNGNKGNLIIEALGHIRYNSYDFDTETEYKKVYVFFKKLLNVWKRTN